MQYCFLRFIHSISAFVQPLKATLISIFAIIIDIHSFTDVLILICCSTLQAFIYWTIKESWYFLEDLLYTFEDNEIWTNCCEQRNDGNDRMAGSKRRLCESWRSKRARLNIIKCQLLIAENAKPTLKRQAIYLTTSQLIKIEFS